MFQAELEITFVDVGAAGGLTSRWRGLAPRLNVIAFEPRIGSST